jgi:hypothetical protein
MMTQEDKTFRTWTGWIDTIRKDVTDLVIGKHVFWEVQDIIKANLAIQKPSSFYGWLGMMYTAWGSMAVRRQLDNDSVSLKKLLSEMANSPELVSRQRYVSAYAATLTGNSEHVSPLPSAASEAQGGAHVFTRAEAERIANRGFDKFAGRGNPYVPKDAVERDISQLREVGENVKVFADKNIAHLVDFQPKALPTFNDLDDCVNVIEALVIKYEQILKRSAPHSLLPTWQYDWKAIFYEPWIARL